MTKETNHYSKIIYVVNFPGDQARISPSILVVRKARFCRADHRKINRKQFVMMYLSGYNQKTVIYIVAML